MKTRGRDQRYGSLEPAERFRLALRASARDDNAEWHRLVESCPMKSYRATDTAFSERVEAARLPAALVIGDRRASIAILHKMK